MIYVIYAPSSFQVEMCKYPLSPSRVVKTGNLNYFNSTDLSIVDSFAVGQGLKDGIYLIFLSEKLPFTFSVK